MAYYIKESFHYSTHRHPIIVNASFTVIVITTAIITTVSIVLSLDLLVSYFANQVSFYHERRWDKQKPSPKNRILNLSS